MITVSDMNLSKLKTNRLLMIAAAVAVALIGGVLLKTFVFSASAETPYVTAAARVADLEQVVLATGELEPRELVRVGAQASGQIKNLAVEVGDVVQAGQLIAEIDSLTQQNTLRDRQAALANVRASRAAQAASLVQAQLDFERQKTMLAADATPRASYDAAVATLDATRAGVAAIDAQIQQAQVAVDTARVNLGYTRVTAPISGTVVAVVTEEGQTVNANQSTPTIVVLARLDTMTVRAQISEADVIKVRAGQTTWFTILGDAERRFTGTVRQVEPAPASIAIDTSSSSTASDEAVYYDGLIDVANADGVLRPSMTAQVSIVLNQVKQATVIPMTALGAKRPDGTYAVQVVDAQGKLEERLIRTGIDDGSDVQVLSGLETGERVVIGGAGDIPASGARAGGLAGGMGGPPPGGMR